MLFIFISLALAQEKETCHFDQPVTMAELKEMTKDCLFASETIIEVPIEEVAPAPAPAAAPQVGIGFHGGGSVLTENSRQTLDGVAAVLTVRKKMGIRIVGYADGAESGDLMELSQLRAQAVADYLTGKGIDPSRIKIEAAGASNPISTVDTAEGHARNRRVEFVLSAL